MSLNASRIRAANTTLIAKGDLDSVGDFFTPDYIAHISGGDAMTGHAAVRDFLRMIQRGFASLQVEVEILVEGKGRVAWQRTVKGVQTGPLRGFPASGKTIIWRDMVASRFENGLIAEEWVVTDLAQSLLLARKR